MRTIMHVTIMDTITRTAAIMPKCIMPKRIMLTTITITATRRTPGATLMRLNRLN
jgi:hypothetical protein